MPGDASVNGASPIGGGGVIGNGAFLIRLRVNCSGSSSPFGLGGLILFMIMIINHA